MTSFLTRLETPERSETSSTRSRSVLNLRRSVTTTALMTCWVAQEIARREKDATIVFVVCDRGDRYLSTGVFPA